MILSGQTIRSMQERRNILTPFVERQTLFGMSYGLSTCGYDVRVAEDVQVKPGRYALASTLEHFQMPDNLVAFVKDKSTWARMGLAVQNTVIEPGWRGFLTLELSNHSDYVIGIKAGAPIAQIVFSFLDRPAEQPYSGKYQDQESGAQKPRYEGDA